MTDLNENKILQPPNRTRTLTPPSLTLPPTIQTLASRNSNSAGQQKDHEGAMARISAAHAAELTAARAAASELERQLAQQAETCDALQKAIER